MATLRYEMVKCGKLNCTKCPHGPYAYAYWKENGRVHKKYLGKVTLSEQEASMVRNASGETISKVAEQHKKVKQVNQLQEKFDKLGKGKYDLGGKGMKILSEINKAKSDLQELTEDEVAFITLGMDKEQYDKFIKNIKIKKSVDPHYERECIWLYENIHAATGTKEEEERLKAARGNLKSLRALAKELGMEKEYWTDSK